MILNEDEALLFLTHISFLGPIKIRLLIHHFGSAVEAANSTPKEWMELPGLGPKIIESWQRCQKQKKWLETLHWCEQHNIQTICYTHSQYPKKLLEIPDFPILLYVKGLLKQEERSLAVIGTRQATIYGLEMAGKISAEIARNGFTVVSGFARGIDTEAHKGAFENGRTIAVLGSGLGHLYPKENEWMVEKIIQKGALITEFSPLTPPDRHHFPRRNRIVSGMSIGTILIEAPRSSGAMITVEQALAQGRKVFALPGRADQENFQGNHHLIKTRQAELIENGKDVIMFYSDLFSPLSFQPSIQKKIPLEKEEDEFFRQLPSQELSIEEMVTKTKLPMAKINVLLMSLVLKKNIKEYPGKIYKKI